MGWGTLAKGPVALVLPALALATTLALAGGTVPGAWRRALRPAAVALGVALAVAVPWYAAMAARHGPEFLRVAILEQNVERFAIDRYRHPGSVLFFVPYLLGGLLPWTGFLPGALSVLRRGDPAPRERFRLFLAVAAGTALVFYSLSASKLANYALVVFPPLAILLALRIDDFLGGDGGRAAFRVAGGVLLAAATALAVAGAVLLSPDAPGEAAEHVARDYPLDAAGLATARAGVYAVAALLGAGGAAAILVGDPRARAAALATAGAGTLLLLLGSAAPLDGDARPWKRFAEEVRREGGPGDAVAVYRRRLPSVTFYLGRPVEWPATAEELAEFLRGPGPRWLILSEEHLPLLRDLPSTDLRDEGAGYRLLRKPGG